ncbi:unnamed protein product [Symbiodinium sp. CCMP2592]|nr:unnamed protein product [Symbiodinium sp. CCMP2592]
MASSAFTSEYLQLFLVFFESLSDNQLLQVPTLVKPLMIPLDRMHFLAAVWHLRPLWDHLRFLLTRIPLTARPYHDFVDVIATALELKNAPELKAVIVTVIAVDAVRYPHFLLILYLLELPLCLHYLRDVQIPSPPAIQCRLRLSPSTPGDLLHQRWMPMGLSLTSRSRHDRNFLRHVPQGPPPTDPAVGVVDAIVLTETVMIVRITTVPEEHAIPRIVTVTDIGVI